MTIIKEYKNTIGKIIFEETGFQCEEEVYQVRADSEEMFVWKYFADISDAERFYKKCIMQIDIVEVIGKYTTEMNNYNYYSNNPGVAVDNYEDIANDIIEMMEKK